MGFMFWSWGGDNLGAFYGGYYVTTQTNHGPKMNNSYYYTVYEISDMFWSNISHNLYSFYTYKISHEVNLADKNKKNALMREMTSMRNVRNA